jgi:LEA14-like dessication related protein
MKKHLLFLALAFVFSGCAQLQNLLQKSLTKPTASVTGARVSGLSFMQIDLLFDVKVDNPNSVGVNLAGFDYGLKINDHSIFSGNKDDALKIEAQASSIIQIPLSLKYDDIYQSVKDLKSKKSSSYMFDGGVSFDLPVLGLTRIPISKSGEVPLISLPKVSVKNITMKTLSWSGAAMQLDIAVKGTGGMDLVLDNLNYGLNIGGQNWVDGKTSDKISIGSGGEKIISIPFKLNFIEMGRSLYDLVTGDSALEYKLLGDMTLSSDNPLLKTAKISFDDLSKIKIDK